MNFGSIFTGSFLTVSTIRPDGTYLPFSADAWRYAGGMTLLGMLMVFSVLAILWIVLAVFKLIFVGVEPKKKQVKTPADEVVATPVEEPSRFLRAATLRRWWIEQENPCEGRDLAISQFFSILGAVSPTVGAVTTPEGGCHRTLYTCCMDTATGSYYRRTESEISVSSVSLGSLDLHGEKVQMVD